MSKSVATIKTAVLPALELQGFGIAFGSGSTSNMVLSGIDLALDAAGVDVLMGPVKSGKSTLCLTLAGAYEGHSIHRSSGKAFLSGKDITTGRRPVVIKQNARLLETPIWQVLRQPSQALAERSPTNWRIWAAEQLDSHGLSSGPAFLDTLLLHTDLVKQRSVLALAQALCGAPLLFLDEPTYGLNDSQAHALLAWIKHLGTQHKLCVVLHNQQQARYLADSIALLGGGRLLAHQPCAEFFTKPANEWVEQFIRTGSLSLPSLNAKPEEIEPVAQHALPTPTPTPDLVKPAAAAIAKPLPLVAKPAPVRPQVALPALSKHSVGLVSSVGQIMLSDSRGTQGFRWIVPGVLAGCPQPGLIAPMEHDLALLERAGVTHLITLTEQDLDQDALREFGIRNTHLSIFDRKTPSLSQMHMLLVVMQRLLDAGELVAVHCKAGLGRTGLVLAAWMIRDGGLSTETVIERLRKINPGYVQNEEQLLFLHAYEADILRRLTA